MELTIAALQDLASKFSLACASVRTKAELEALKREWLGKEGTIKNLFQRLREVPHAEKPSVAAKMNELKSQAENFVLAKEQELAASERAQSLTNEYIDTSLPALSPGLGRVHPITIVERRIAELLKPFGFVNIPGPEIENEYYCFDSLNIPPHHPARDMQDTFYVNAGDLWESDREAPEGNPRPISGVLHLLRTHTTSVQARTLEKGSLPVKVASFGRVYRNETEDASHQAMFHQFELVWIERGLTLSNLMALITHILKGLYGKRRKVRFVPKFYPYTEPSIGPQIDCSICKGSGCGACGGSGWVTIAGAGMVHRNVLSEFKYNPEEVTGFAFGLGTSRLACQLCGLPTLKLAYENDLRVYEALP
jgi:phenylalanyl-tRNA synthetase alpha chain